MGGTSHLMARIVFPVTVASNRSDGWIAPAGQLNQFVTTLLSLNFASSFTGSDVTLRVREEGYPAEIYTVKDFSLAAVAGDAFGADALAKLSAYVKSYEWQFEFSTPQAADTQVVLTVN